MDIAVHFFAGVFLCNCIPHLVSGLLGQPFPTVFSCPPGIGNSSPAMNIIWGSINVVLGCGLLLYMPFEFGLNTATATLAAGAFITGLILSVHFDKVRRGGYKGHNERC